MLLENKTVIVTGASSGIGEAAALLFAAQGANVVLGARRQKQLADLSYRIQENKGSSAFLAGDVSDETYASALVELAEAKFGGLDAAFNNAGVMGDMGPVTSMSSDNWNTVIDINLTSAFHAAKHQIPAMARRGGGSIVFTSTFVGYTIGLPGMAAYAASKAGLIGLTQVLAVEHGADNIRINALVPGGTKTAMAGDDPDTHAWISSIHALKRMASSDEIAKAALFLISEQSSFVTGSAMVADGGNSVTKG